MTYLHVDLLGTYKIVLGTRVIRKLDSPKLSALFALLALNRTAHQNRDHVAALLWPDCSDAEALSNLRKLLYRFQLALPEATEVLNFGRTTLSWQANVELLLDVDVLKGIISREPTAKSLSEAVGLYRGVLLPGCYDEWLLAAREQLQNEYQRFLEKSLRHFEEHKQFAEVVQSAQALIAIQPLHEEACRYLMRAAALSGDRLAALKVYQEYAARLLEEAGENPGSEFEHEYRRLRNSAVPTSPVQSRRALVGRKAEVEQCERVWKQAFERRAQVLLFSGPAGVGKTHLAESVLTRLELMGIRTARATCYATYTGLSYAPIAELLQGLDLTSITPLWLTEISRLMPELRERHPELLEPPPIRDALQRLRFFQALSRAVLAGQPIAVLVDDIMWCDIESLNFLSFLLQNHPKAQLLMIWTLREEDLNESEYLKSTLLPQLERAGLLTLLNVPNLNLPELSELARMEANHALEQYQLEWLYRETEGNPLYLIEMLPLAHERRELSLPNGIVSAISSRLNRLSPRGLIVARVASVVGGLFSVQTLFELNALTWSDLIDAVDELQAQRVFQELMEGDLRFSHCKIGEVLYSQLSSGRRRLLHREVAEALVRSRGGNELVTEGSKVAYHFEKAGLLSEAIKWHLAAATTALTLDAQCRCFREILRLADSSTPLQQRLTALVGLLASAMSQLDLAQAKGLMLQLETLERETRDILVKAVIQERAAIIAQFELRTLESVRLMQESIDLAREANDRGMLARVLSRKAVLVQGMGDVDHSIVLSREAVHIAAHLPDRNFYHDILCAHAMFLAKLGEDKEPEALEMLETASKLEPLADAKTPSKSGATVHPYRAIALGHMRRYAEAFPLFERIAEESRRQGNVQAELVNCYFWASSCLASKAWRASARPLERLKNLAEEVNDQYMLLTMSYLFGLRAAMVGSDVLAEKFFLSMDPTSSTSRIGSMRCLCLRQLVSLALERGELARAEQLCEIGLQSIRDSVPTGGNAAPSGEDEIALAVGMTLLAKGERDRGLQRLAGLGPAQTRAAQPRELLARVLQADALLGAGREAEALNMLPTSLSMVVLLEGELVRPERVWRTFERVFMANGRVEQASEAAARAALVVRTLDSEIDDPMERATYRLKVHWSENLT